MCVLSSSHLLPLFNCVGTLGYKLAQPNFPQEMAGYIKYDTSIQGILYNNLLKTEMQVDIYRHGEITALNPNTLLREKYRLQKTCIVYVYV